MSNPVFSGCGEVLAYSAIATWLITWGIRRIRYNKDAHDKQMKGWLARPENKNYLLSVMGGNTPKETLIPQDVTDFMAKLNQMTIGDSFLPSVIPEDDLKYLDQCVKYGLLDKEFYKGIGDLYHITDKGRIIL